MALKLKATKEAINLATNSNIISFNGTEPVLISGCYYIPQVSEDGVLTWVPSGADMPVIEPANIKGPAGESGVYIGLTPGENDRVWIQPDATAEIPYATKDEVNNAIDEAINSIVVVDEVSY